MKKNLKTICIIPARGGSKGLRNKNILKVGNTSLIGRTIHYAKNCGLIDNIIVTTDSDKIAKEAKKYGAEIPFLRPSYLSKDLSTTEDTLKHALLKYESITSKKFDLCVFLSPTDLFRDDDWINLAIRKMKTDNYIESVFVGYETHKNFWSYDDNKKPKRLKPWMKNYTSRQVRKKIFREDTGLCCVSRARLWRRGKRIGDKVFIIKNHNGLASIDIHEKKDLDLANIIIKNGLSK